MSTSLPEGWISQIDPATKREFYVNTTTGVSQWEPPAPASQPSETPAQPPKEGAATESPVPNAELAAAESGEAGERGFGTMAMNFVQSISKDSKPNQQGQPPSQSFLPGNSAEMQKAEGSALPIPPGTGQPQQPQPPNIFGQGPSTQIPATPGQQQYQGPPQGQGQPYQYQQGQSLNEAFNQAAGIISSALKDQMHRHGYGSGSSGKNGKHGFEGMLSSAFSGLRSKTHGQGPFEEQQGQQGQPIQQWQSGQPSLPAQQAQPPPPAMSPPPVAAAATAPLASVPPSAPPSAMPQKVQAPPAQGFAPPGQQYAPGPPQAQPQFSPPPAQSPPPQMQPQQMQPQQPQPPTTAPAPPQFGTPAPANSPYGHPHPPPIDTNSPPPPAQFTPGPPQGPPPPQNAPPGAASPPMQGEKVQGQPPYPVTPIGGPGPVGFGQVPPPGVYGKTGQTGQGGPPPPSQEK